MFEKIKKVLKNTWNKASHWNTKPIDSEDIASFLTENFKVDVTGEKINNLVKKGADAKSAKPGDANFDENGATYFLLKPIDRSPSSQSHYVKGNSNGETISFFVKSIINDGYSEKNPNAIFKSLNSIVVRFSRLGDDKYRVKSVGIDSRLACDSDGAPLRYYTVYAPSHGVGSITVFNKDDKFDSEDGSAEQPTLTLVRQYAAEFVRASRIKIPMEDFAPTGDSPNPVLEV